MNGLWRNCELLCHSVQVGSQFIRLSSIGYLSAAVGLQGGRLLQVGVTAEHGFRLLAGALHQLEDHGVIDQP